MTTDPIIEIRLTQKKKSFFKTEIIQVGKILITKQQIACHIVIGEI